MLANSFAGRLGRDVNFLNDNDEPRWKRYTVMTITRAGEVSLRLSFAVAGAEEHIPSWQLRRLIGLLHIMPGQIRRVGAGVFRNHHLVLFQRRVALLHDVVHLAG